MENTDKIKGNIEKILREVAGINREIKLIGVTKTVPVKRIIAAIDAGLTEFGENRIQEAVPKIEALNKNFSSLNWHFIGHLQSNKVKRAVKYFEMIQSADSSRLVEKISGAMAGTGKKMNILLEIKISAEAAKTGIAPEETFKVMEEIKDIKDINIKGLMAMAPYSDEAEESRPYFKKVKKLFDEIKRNYSQGNVQMEYLSMGMTGDYRVAAEEGSNMIRLGRAIFEKMEY